MSDAGAWTAGAPYARDAAGSGVSDAGAWTASGPYARDAAGSGVSDGGAWTAGAPYPRDAAGPGLSDAGAWTASAPYARAINDPTAQLVLHADSGETLVLDAAKFSAPPDAVDKAVLDRCLGPTLDLGCGPGRLVAELAGRGVPALGVDVAPFALLLSRANGASALRRSIFDRLPGAGRWPHALLMDGNIGIGGDPGALLERLRTLLRPGSGELIIETEAEDIDVRYRVRFGVGGASAGGRPGTASRGNTSEEFGWARIGSESLLALAGPLGYVPRQVWAADGRRFVALNYSG